MRFDVLTLFPDMFTGPFGQGVIGRAQQRGLVHIRCHDIRRYAHDRNRTVDDYPYGGGPGMLMKPEPLFEAVEAVRTHGPESDDPPVILLSPQGRTLTHQLAKELARKTRLILICGRYEGVDERVRLHLATDEVSVGDYVLSGGEPAAIVVIDAIARLVPGVVGSGESTLGDTFASGILGPPEYTRPAEYCGWPVPEELLSGNHAEIARWRRREALRRTLALRPDLLPDACLSDDDRAFLASLRCDA